jgi:hypothetical protein
LAAWSTSMTSSTPTFCVSQTISVDLYQRRYPDMPRPVLKREHWRE